MPISRQHDDRLTAASQHPAEVSLVSGLSVAAMLQHAFEANARAPRPGTVFHQTGLLLAALAALPPEQGLVAAVKRAGTVQTLWPLRIDRRVYGVKLATDLASPLTQYSEVIGEPLDSDTFRALRELLRTQHGVDAILCRSVRADSGLAAALTGAPEASIDQDAAPYVDLQAFDTFEAYCEQFSKQTLRTRRQRRRKLEAAHGALGFTVLSGSAGQEAVARALQWKQQWLREQALSSRVVGADEQEAMLIAAINGPGVHVSVLSADNRPIAIELGFANRQHYAAFMGAFDPALASFSPVQEQMMLTLEWCFERGFSRYDLLPPRDAYKLQWTKGRGEEPVQDYCIPLTPLGTLYKLARQHARARIKRAILALPKDVRARALRYGPIAAGIGGATAAALGILAD